jgi:hypothetical protein
MTYPTPPSGVPGGQPWPQQPPAGPGQPQDYPAQAPGYAPPYPQYPAHPSAGYGQQPYGYPQPGYGYDPNQPGYGYPQAPGYGYPPQPPMGFGPPAPKSGGSAKWWIIGAVAVLAVIALVVTIVLVAASNDSTPSTASGQFGGSSSSPTSADEEQIRSLLTSPPDTSDPQKLVEQHFCANDQAVLGKLGGLGALDVPGGLDGKQTPQVSIADIKVNGDRATANLDISGAGGPSLPGSTIYFRKESGDWKFCLTDSPALKGLPGLGGH